MTTLAEIDNLDIRLKSLGRDMLTNLRYANLGVLTQFWDVNGDWIAPVGISYRDDGNAAMMALISTLFVTTKPRDLDLYNVFVKTAKRHIANQCGPSTAKPGFWNNGHAEPGSELDTGHNLLNWAIAYNNMAPFLNADMKAAILASYKAGLDQLWLTIGNGGGGHMFFVNFNYNFCFEVAFRWYGLVTGDATYTGYADLMFDFIMNGYTSGVVSSVAPGWPVSISGGNLANPAFANFGFKFSTIPVADDWSDGVGWGVENGGQLNNTGNPPTNTTDPLAAGYSFDPDYGGFATYIAVCAYHLTGDRKYLRIFNAQFNKVKTVWNLSSTAVVVKPGGLVAGAGPFTVTLVDAGVGGAVRFTTSAPHGFVNGNLAYMIGLVGSGVVTAQNGLTRYVRNVTSTTFEIETTPGAPVIFGGTYTSGGTVQEGGLVDAWQINGYRGSRHNTQVGCAHSSLLFAGWISGVLNTSAYLVPSLTKEGNPAGSVAADGVIENNNRVVATVGANSGAIRSLGLELSMEILLTQFARGSFARNRGV